MKPKYYRCIDQGLWDELVDACFTEDAARVFGEYGLVNGREVLGAFIQVPCFFRPQFFHSKAQGRGGQAEKQRGTLRSVNPPPVFHQGLNDMAAFDLLKGCDLGHALRRSLGGFQLVQQLQGGPLSRDGCPLKDFPTPGNCQASDNSVKRSTHSRGGGA